jgi:dihydrofolate reductase
VGSLVYTGLVSLDGYFVDAAGNFDWAEPDPEVHAFVNDLERLVGTHLYGRRLYEVMLAWESMDTTGEPREIADYATVWRGADKIVYSTTLGSVSSARTRLEREFDVEAVRRLKDETVGRISIGGPTLAAHAVRAGLVDEFHVFVSPVIVGGGTRYLPEDAHLELQLDDERRFDNGVVYSGYRATPAVISAG